MNSSLSTPVVGAEEGRALRNDIYSNRAGCPVAAKTAFHQKRSGLICFFSRTSISIGIWIKASCRYPITKPVLPAIAACMALRAYRSHKVQRRACAHGNGPVAVLEHGAACGKVDLGLAGTANSRHCHTRFPPAWNGLMPPLLSAGRSERALSRQATCVADAGNRYGVGDRIG
jgi:hypothetical protein